MPPPPSVDPDHRFGALFAAGPVGPAVELEAADDAHQGSLANVISRHLGLLAPDLQVEPVGFVAGAAAVDGEGEVGDHAARFEITDLRVAAGPADEGDGIHAHGDVSCADGSMMRHPVGLPPPISSTVRAVCNTLL
jgi:hypothetical protein